MGLIDLFRQAAGILQPAHGGTGSTHGEERVVQRCMNSTGGTLALGTVVEFTFGANDRRVRAVAAANATTVLGGVVGYFDGQELVEADCPDGFEIAVQTAGIAELLISAAVTRGELAFVSTTDGEILSSSTAAAGAIGYVVASRDPANGDTTAPVAFPLSAAASSGGSFGTPALTLSTTNGAGAASTGIRTDATIAAFDSTAPVDQAFGDTAATGNSPVAARRNHRHGMPANPATGLAHSSLSGLTIGDDHTQYQKESEKSAANGYASLDAGAIVPRAELGSGSGGAGLKYLKDDGTWGAAGAGSGIGWIKDVDESGVSFANWTTLSGTWSSDGTTINETDATSLQREARLTAKTPNTVRILEAEVQGVDAGFFAGILIGDGGNDAGWFQLGVDDSTNVAQFKAQTSGSTLMSLSTPIVTGTWYKLRLWIAGNGATAWIDGTLIGSYQANVTQGMQYLALVSWARSKFRNIKAWYIDLPA